MHRPQFKLWMLLVGVAVAGVLSGLLVYLNDVTSHYVLGVAVVSGTCCCFYSPLTIAAVFIWFVSGRGDPPPPE